MSYMIDMSDLDTRKQVIIVTGISRLKLEIKFGPRFFPRNYPSVLSALQKQGLVSKTKKKMLVEAEEWLVNNRKEE